MKSDPRKDPYFDAHYVLLVRHGQVCRKRDDCKDQEKALAAEPLSDKGRDDAKQVSGTLKQVIQELPKGTIRIGRILHAPSEHAKETAEIFGEKLKAPLASRREPLDPHVYGPYENRGYETTFKTTLEKELMGNNDQNSSNAIMVVGHQPFLGWLAYEFLGEPVALARSELACLRGIADGRQSKLFKEWYLWWNLEPSDTETQKELSAKIKSKMDLAKILGVFIIAVFGWIFREPRRFVDMASFHDSQQAAFYLAGIMLLFSIGLYFGSMYAYDRLLMPTRFWADKASKLTERPHWLVWRPPGSTNRVLYANMVRVWDRLFTPASVFAIVGIAFYAYSIFPAGAEERYLTFWGVGLVMAIALALILYHLARPRLGTDD